MSSGSFSSVYKHISPYILLTLFFRVKLLKIPGGFLFSAHRSCTAQGHLAPGPSQLEHLWKDHQWPLSQCVSCCIVSLFPEQAVYVLVFPESRLSPAFSTFLLCWLPLFHLPAKHWGFPELLILILFLLRAFSLEATSKCPSLCLRSRPWISDPRINWILGITTWLACVQDVHQLLL